MVKFRPFGGMFLHGEDGSMRSVLTREDGTPIPQMSVESPHAALLADLVSLHTDLWRAAETCRIYRSTAPDGEALRALFESIVITYGRSFIGGRSAQSKRSRTRLDDLVVTPMPADLREIHDRVMALRNRHVGHRVSDDERVWVVAIFDEAGRFDEADPLLTSVAGEGPTVSGLTRVLEWALPRLEAEISRVNGIVNQECAAALADVVVVVEPDETVDAGNDPPLKEWGIRGSGYRAVMRPAPPSLSSLGE